MATLSVQNPPFNGTMTLGTANQAAIITLYSPGLMSINSPSALEYDFDTTTVEDDDESSTVGEPIPAAQGREFIFRNAKGGTQINVWSATGSAVVTVTLTQV